MTTVVLIFLLLVVYQLKHWLADYPLQNEYMLGKFRPGWDFLGPLLSHVSTHFIFTTLISATVLFYFNHPAPIGFGMLIGLGDGFVHFFMDRIKAGPKYMGRWKMLSAAEYVELKPWADAPDSECEGLDFTRRKNARKRLRGNVLFWWALGLDQAVHHLTDYAAIYAVLKIAGLV